MKGKPAFIGILLVVFFVSTAVAEQESNYLVRKCESIIPGDFISALEVSDVEGSGTLNILAGTSYNGVLYNFVYDSSTNCYYEWAAKSQYSAKGSIDEIVVRDANKDGKKEIIFNGAKSKKTTGQLNPDQYATVLSMVNGQLLFKWGYNQGDSGCQFSNSVDTAPLYGADEDTLLIGTESGRVCTFVNWSKNRRVLGWVTAQLDKNPVEYMQAADFNKDGKSEIIVLTNKLYLSSVYLLSSAGTILWTYKVPGKGVRIGESKNLAVADLDGDGLLETIIGTQDHGVDVLDSSGKLKWNYKTDASGKVDIVSNVKTYKYLTSDENLKIVVAAKPYIYLLDSTGSLLWKAKVDTTVFDFDYGDIDKDGKNELVAGATSYIFVYGDSGQLKGQWSYAAEIQGLTGAYKMRDMDTVKLRVYDFDKDGNYEIVAAFKWFDDQLDLNVQQGSIRVFEINPDYNPGTATAASNTAATTQPSAEKTSATTVKTSPTTPQTTRPGGTTATTKPKDDSSKKGICPCIPLLPAAIALAAALALGLPLALRKN
jgi:hypothetical protein